MILNGCIDFLCNVCQKHFSSYEVSRSLCTVSLIFVRSLLKLEFSVKDFRKKKHSNIIFHENSSDGSRFVPCGVTDRRTDMTMLIGAFRYFAKRA